MALNSTWVRSIADMTSLRNFAPKLWISAVILETSSFSSSNTYANICDSGKYTQALAAIREVGRETALEISRVAGSAVDALHQAQAGFEEKRAQAYEKIVHGAQRATSAVSHGVHLAAESGADAEEFVKNGICQSTDAVVDAAKTVGGTLHKGFVGETLHQGFVGETLHKGFDFAKETGGGIMDGFGRGVGEVEKGLADTGRAIGSKFHEASEGVQQRLHDVWEFDEATLLLTLADAGYEAWDLKFRTEEACVAKVRQAEEAVIRTGKNAYARGAAVGRCIKRKVFGSPEKGKAEAIPSKYPGKSSEWIWRWRRNDVIEMENNVIEIKNDVIP